MIKKKINKKILRKRMSLEANLGLTGEAWLLNVDVIYQLS